MDVYIVNAFTKNNRGGNAAGVCIPKKNLSKDEMIYIAKEMNLSEVAFVNKSEKADFRISFFTPNKQIDLCGHATIATFSKLFNLNIIDSGEYLQETNAGLLRVKVNKDGRVLMEQNKLIVEEVISKDQILSSLGLKKEDVLEIFIGSTGVKDIFINLREDRLLKNLKVDFKQIEQISKENGVTGYHVFTTNIKEADALARNFAPLYGIDEESATGTANAVLGSYLVSKGLKEKNEKIIIFQGMYMNQTSEICVEVDDKNIPWVGGFAQSLDKRIF